MSDEETRPEHAALDDGEDPTEFVGDFTTPDVDLTDLLGDDHQDQDEAPTSRHDALPDTPPEEAADEALPVRGDSDPGGDQNDEEVGTDG